MENNMIDKPYQLQRMVLASLMAALMAVGAFIAIPIGPVPLVLQNMFVLLNALLLGPRRGSLAIILYLVAGSIGLPVFSGAKRGLGVLFGPTGGFLLSYVPAVILAGWISQLGQKVKTQPKLKLAVDFVSLVLASILIYSCGVSWLRYIAHLTWSQALALGCYPFILGDIFKIIGAMALAKVIRPILERSFK